jgi:hypothetical protein
MGRNNTLYIPSKQFQEGILDKDTGKPLSTGKVYTFKDSARTEPKPLYRKVDSIPNNTYEPLPNPVILSNIGTFNECTNDIIPYFYPYDENGNLELYYIRVTNSEDVEQFTRVAQPNLSELTPEEEIEEINYIPNGQFSSHNDVPLIDILKDPGEITQAVTEIAPGNWTYERTEGSSAKDIVIFERFASASIDPTGNPRYAVRIKCEIVDGDDEFKELRLKFRDVNKFTSPVGQIYNFSFVAKTNIGTLANFTVRATKHFGDGGSPDEEILIEGATKSVGDLYTAYSVNINFDDNVGKTIGDNDDDYVMLQIAFAEGAQFDFSLTNFVLIVGDQRPLTYPLRTVNQDIYKSLAGSAPVPQYAGQNLYLPVINTPNGFAYDDSQIGMVFHKAILGLSIGELYCNGEKYLTSAYSSDGIPYQRLFDKLWQSFYLITQYGSGKSFVNAFPFDYGYPMDINKIIVYENSFGNTTATADGSVATGFTFVNEGTYPARDYETAYQFSVQTAAGSSITEGAYWIFYTPKQEPHPPDPAHKKYIVWYSKLADSSPPSESADGKIKVLYSDSDTDKDIAKSTLLAINQYYYAVPDYRGRFLRVNDILGDKIGYRDLDARWNVVGVYKVNAQGSGYAVGDLIEIPGGTGANAKVKVLAVLAGAVTEILLYFHGWDYFGLGTGRQDNVSTVKLTGSGIGLTLDIEIGETRGHNLLMDDFPVDFGADYEYVGTTQNQDTAGTGVVNNVATTDGAASNTYPGTKETPLLYHKDPTDDQFAHDFLKGRHSFIKANHETYFSSPNTYVEFGHGHETRPQNVYINAIIKY